ncbi:hypothetical protein [Virgibacillus halodenitrificans]|uniref:hypothetical protein n=1 Tax=Virgibacillus halodenitrificans TaxID=1482 RepID=UPI000EF44ADC|nr:hypothetical protein [Virgibacillus halodenitrificans]
MLKIVVDNTNIKEKVTTGEKTCRKNCVLFNEETTSCPIFKGLDYDNPKIVKRCLEFNDIEEVEKVYNELDYQNSAVTLIEDNSSVDTDMDFLFDLTGNRKSLSESNYPIKPDIPFNEKMEGLFWYTAPDQSFGCWVKNNCEEPFGIIPSSIDEVKQGWANNIYCSPVPLHDHKASESLKTRMCWLVDKEGWGQYTVIIANDIKFITFPKPNKW